MSFEDLVIKRVISTGLKITNLNIIREKRHNCPYDNDDEHKPFIKKFKSEFNKLPKILREKLISAHLDGNVKDPNDKVSNLLKDHFSLKFTKLSDKQKNDFIFKYKYVKDWWKSSKKIKNPEKSNTISKRDPQERHGLDSHLRKTYEPD